LEVGGAGDGLVCPELFFFPGFFPVASSRLRFELSCFLFVGVGIVDRRRFSLSPSVSLKILTKLAPRTNPDRASPCCRSLGGRAFPLLSNSLMPLLPSPPMAACFPAALALLPSSPGARGCTLRGSRGPVEDIGGVDDDDEEEEEEEEEDARRAERAQQEVEGIIGHALDDDEERRSKACAAAAAAAAGGIARARCCDDETLLLLLPVLATAAEAREVWRRGMVALLAFAMLFRASSRSEGKKKSARVRREPLVLPLPLFPIA
jgi:hypothetical protein